MHAQIRGGIIVNPTQDVTGDGKSAPATLPEGKFEVESPQMYLEDASHAKRQAGVFLGREHTSNNGLTNGLVYSGLCSLRTRLLVMAPVLQATPPTQGLPGLWDSDPRTRTESY